MAFTDVARIASNLAALNALNSLSTINKQPTLHQTRMSTGKRINSAADDPAGMTIATKMLAYSDGLKVAQDNIGDASKLLDGLNGSNIFQTGGDPRDRHQLGDRDHKKSMAF